MERNERRFRSSGSMSIGVWGFVYYSWKEGYREYYWGWALLFPVNLVALVWYSTSPFWTRIYKNKKHIKALQTTSRRVIVR